ncbi:MAG: NADH:flavin oxidoreductase/NADH oxidase [Microbacteriaceae bacterium]|nr:NADH:flavin oxidoreductase/NADH oxidase [Microbacteriaceae bacterium]
MTPRLFEPLAIRSQTFANRLWVSPMCQYSAVDGVVQPWHLAHLGGLALGRPGLIIAEKTAVLPEGRITPQCAGIWDAERAAAWARIVGFVTGEQGVPLGIQLGHAGRKASTYAPRPGSPAGSVPLAEGGWETVGPSPLAFGEHTAPRELSATEIEDLVRAFADAAKRAEDAGFAVVEIHGAHGYLIHQFLSPLSNVRTDGYGGSAEGRMRFAVEVAEAVRAAVSIPVFMRLSANDWVEGGLVPEDFAAIVPALEAAGVDLFDVSTGGLDPRQRIALGPGYQVPAARTLKSFATVPVTSVGLITEAAQAEQILVDGDADAVFAGREFLRDRELPRRAAAELGAEVDWPWQYERAKPRRA